jgi:hypothetical protein
MSVASLLALFRKSAAARDSDASITGVAFVQFRSYLGLSHLPDSLKFQNLHSQGEEKLAYTQGSTDQYRPTLNLQAQIGKTCSTWGREDVHTGL